MTKRIMVFGDSNSWGYIAGTNAERFDAHVRWPGVLQSELGQRFVVLEEALNGRTTAWDDPFKLHRNGSRHLPVLLESHHPLDLVIIKLGVNDLKSHFGLTAAEVALGVASLVEIVQQSPAAPPTLVVCPTRPVETDSMLRTKFAGAVQRSAPLAEAFREVLSPLGVPIVDANEVAVASPVDGVHLDAAAHQAIGQQVAQSVQKILT